MTGTIHTWKDKGGWPITVFSHEALMAQSDYTGYVWPVEGEFIDGEWEFHKGFHTEGWEFPSGPLMVDNYTASAYRVVANALNDENRAKLKKLSEEHRGIFAGYVMPEIVWPRVG
jgi:hypothetical protein